MIMNIQADIEWIYKELNNLKDPELILAFKRLLQIRKKNQAMIIEDYNREIAQAEKDIKEGRLITIDEVKKNRLKWKSVQ